MTRESNSLGPLPDDDLLGGALRSMRDGAEPALELDQALRSARLERLHDEVVRQARAGSSRWRVRRWILPAVAAAALAAGVALLPGVLEPPRMSARSVNGQAQLLRGGERRAVGEAATALAPGDVLETRAGAELELVTPRNVQVVLHEDGVLAVDAGASDQERMRLERGLVHVTAGKQAAGQRFTLSTPEATVVVRGTEFVVESREHAGALRTCVKVAEGLVSVYAAGKTSWINAGGQWGCERAPFKEPIAAGAPSPHLAPEGAAPPPTPEPAPRAPRLPAEARKPTSDAATLPSAEPRVLDQSLIEQNRLMQKALLHQRQREWRDAERAYEELLARYPSSPLAPEARAQLGAVRSALRR